MVTNPSKYFIEIILLIWYSLGFQFFQEITDAEEVPLETDETPKIDWPLRKIPVALCYDDEEDRPDSGVGESVSLLSNLRLAVF